MTKNLLELAGIGSDRLTLEWCSSAEAQRFAQICKDVTQKTRRIGKFDPKAVALQLDAAEMALSGETMRWIVGKELRITTKGDVYKRKWNVEAYEEKLDASLQREYEKCLIYLSIKDGCENVRDIADKSGLPLQRISYLLADLEKTNLVEFRGMKEKKPVFAVL